MLDVNDEVVDEIFPMSSYRSGQFEVIRKALEFFKQGCRFVFIEAPTGAGKSAIGYTIAQLAKNSFYLAPQKFLQDQLSADFGEGGKHLSSYPMVELKGRNAYPCEYYEQVLNDPTFSVDPGDLSRYRDLSRQDVRCDKGECKRKDESKLKYCTELGKFTCAYYLQLWKAKASNICLMNFHSFLYQSAFSKQFGPRELMIIDEAHGTEDVLLQFIEISLNDKDFRGIEFPELDSPAEYIEFFTDINLLERIESNLHIAKLTEDLDAVDLWKRLQHKFSMFMKSDPSKWVCEFKVKADGLFRSVTFKPIFVDDFVNKYLYVYADKFLFMSATILSKNIICDALAIPRDEAKLIRVSSTFPAKNRPVYVSDCGPITYNNKEKVFPKLIDCVNMICKSYEGKRGIIHTHNFEICRMLLKECDKDVRCRFLYQNSPEFSGDKRVLLEKHKNTRDSVIIAPAMHEGLDLKDDLGRFQIICKIPYPPKNDPQIAARMELSPGYYSWRTVTKLLQSCGRTVRHENDRSDTYVLDSQFFRLFYQDSYLFPEWFRESVET